MDPFEQLWGPSPSANPGPLTLNLLKHFEGYTPEPKWDSKQYSVGYSTRWQPGAPVGTREDHEAALAREAGQTSSWLDRNVKTPLDDTKRAALTSAGFNLGTGDKGIGALLPDINAGDWPRVAGRLRTFNKSDGEVNPGLVSRRNIEASMLLGGSPPTDSGAPAPTQTETKPMPMPFQDDPQRPQQQGGPLANAMGGMFGSGDQPGYFGRLMADPTFMMGAAVLGSGLSGKDAGTALTQGAQAASAVSTMSEKRRRDAAWQKIMGNGTPDPNSPILKGIPPEVLPIIHAMGPEQGMQVLGQIAMKKMSPHQLTSVAPGASLYDEQGGKEVYRAPDASKLPAGYQAGPDGGLAFIPGGPADPALKVKEVQYSEGASRAANFGNMMAEAEKSLEGMAKKGPNGEQQALQNPNGLGGTLRESMMPDALANTMRSSDYQNYRQAAMQWARAKLRKESGAAISNNEFEGEFQTYFPQYGDGPEVIKQKQQARQQAQEGMIAESRGAYNQLFGAKRAPGVGAAPGAAPAVQPGAAAAQPQAPAAPPPQPGQVEDGYRFKGGNPADPNSWERMQ